MHHKHYHPGVCNIGKDEVSSRKRNFVFWLLLLIASTGVLLFADINIFVSMMMEFGLMVATAISLLQITNQFCIVFGFIGKYNFAKKGYGDKVTQPDFRIADRRKALMIIAQAILIAAVFATVFYFVKRIFFIEGF